MARVRGTPTRRWPVPTGDRSSYYFAEYLSKLVIKYDVKNAIGYTLAREHFRREI